MAHVGVEWIIALAAVVLIHIDIGVSQRRHAEIDKCVAQRRVAATAAKRPGCFHDLRRGYMALLVSGATLFFAGLIRLSYAPMERVIELPGLE